MAKELNDDGCHVALTHELLDVKATMDRVRSPKAGAIVIFAGTTRDNFGGKPVKELQYTSYEPKALKTMLSICKAMKEKHSLTAIFMVHRLGVVPIGEESILIAVSSPHRDSAWRAGEEALEECKEKVEVWKKEEFGGEDGGVWRANRDGAVEERIDAKGAVSEADTEEPGTAGEGIDVNDSVSEMATKADTKEHEAVGERVDAKEAVSEAVSKANTEEHHRPIMRPGRPGERGHGPVTHPNGIFGRDT